jgi:cytochrome c peroxidase
LHFTLALPPEALVPAARKPWLMLCVALLATSAARADGPKPAADAEAQTLASARSLFGVREPATKEDPAKVALGRRLFFETRLSADGKVGCVSCHLPTLWATDGKPLAIGTGGKENPRNSPTIFDVYPQVAQHWRGDRESLEDQAMKALLGPASFGLPSQDAAMEKLKGFGYEPAFKAAFAGEAAPLNVKNFAAALSAYERTLRTRAPFDAWIEGDAKALSPAAKAGLAKFIEVGCTACHNGPLLGGKLFQKFGLIEEYAKYTGSKKIDLGRFDVSKNEDDKHFFKVPRLRNVAKTAPYFHDGSVAKLEEAVVIMAKVNLGRELAPAEAQEIVTFLEALTGPVPEGFSPPPEK